MMKDFLFTLLAWLFTLPVIVGALGFAIYNANLVAVTVSPFLEPVPMPMYVPVLVAVAFGFMFGALMTWAGMGHLRKARREQAKRIKILEKEIQAANGNRIISHNYALVPPQLLDKR